MSGCVTGEDNVASDGDVVGDGVVVRVKFNLVYKDGNSLNNLGLQQFMFGCFVEDGGEMDKRI